MLPGYGGKVSAAYGIDFSVKTDILQYRTKQQVKPWVSTQTMKITNTGDYTFMTACEVSGDIHEGFEVRILPSGKYAKFIVIGNMMTAVGEFWQKLWQMPLERTYLFDFEEYRNDDPENCEVHIYIGIK